MKDEALEKLVDYAEKQRAEASACRNCGFFAVRGDDKVGECWRYPPAEPIVAGDEWARPVVHRDAVCGEFVHKRTGKSLQADPFRQMSVRVARLEEEIERLRREQA